MKKLLTTLLAILMVIGLAGCSKADKDPLATRELDVAAYEAESQKIYDAQLGEFYTTYLAAKEHENLSEKFAYMALAEAKLLESGMFLPLTTRGGLYSMTRVAPHTIDYSLWGNDSDNFDTALIATDFITKEDREALRTKWVELKGTGTYYDYAKKYLADHGYTLQDVYGYAYSSDPQTWDYLATSRAADSEAIVLTLRGLYEYDCEGVQKPALALSHEVSEDGLTYTFHLRDDASWVDNQGSVVAPVTADDFVAGMQHMMDAQGGLEYLIYESCSIHGAGDYIDGVITDFAEVGVKAIDEHTVQYTLDAPCTYFTTMLGYNVFAPLCRTYFESLGGQFGLEAWAAATSTCTYGTTPETIVYCGPYVVTSIAKENSIVFEQNPTFYDKDRMTVKTVNWYYNDGTDALKPYNDAVAGTLVGCSLTAASLEKAKADGNFEKYASTADTDATSFCGFVNVNRYKWSNVADGAVLSTQTVSQAARTNAALNNANFRRAILFALDRGAYNACTDGEEVKYNALRNTYTPGGFVMTEEECTVNINGVATVIPAFTNYGAIVQMQLDADGVAIKAYNAETGSSDGFDGWYNPANAKAELAVAIDALKAAGVEVSKENPIYVDYPNFEGSEIYSARGQVFKKSIEDALDGCVVINLCKCDSSNDWYNAGYYTDYGYEANYDIYDVSGWGPDYGDPSTYLDTMLPNYSGYMAKCFGIY